MRVRFSGDVNKRPRPCQIKKTSRSWPAKTIDDLREFLGITLVAALEKLRYFFLCPWCNIC